MALTPEEMAELIADSIPEIERRRGRRTTRFQLSSISLCKIADRNFMDHFFLQALASELLEVGWCMVQISNTKFGFILRDSAANWVKFASKKFVDD